ncbi:MAG: hypothetical protein HY784_06645, partial [Chloroflexi bacterium]|nr:hypothetical protein [Chloroflexota bacterium]
PIDYWRGPERNAERYYAEQLMWIDREMRKDPYVLGACIFTFGHAGDPTWEHFEVGGTKIPTFVLQYVNSVRNQADPTVVTASCVNNARYVADITIPDGAPVAPGAAFLKTWRVKNTGTCEWSQGYRLGFDGGERMGAADATPLPAKVAANGEVELSVSLTAPAAPGSYTARFRLRDDKGQPFGGPLTVVIRVQASPESKPRDSAADHAALPQQPERPEYANNLFSNPGFEAGFYFADDTRELAAPSGWLLKFAGPATPRLEGQTEEFQRPITAVISPNSVPREERAILFRGREACFKVSGSRSPIWVTLLPSIAGLRPGQTYRFTAHVLPEMVMTAASGGSGAPGSKTYAASPLAGEVRLVIESAGQAFDTGWKDGNQTPYGRYDTVNLRFVAPDSRASFRVEVRSRWRAPGGGWYIDEMGLEAI